MIIIYQRTPETAFWVHVIYVHDYLYYVPAYVYHGHAFYFIK